MEKSDYLKLIKNEFYKKYNPLDIIEIFKKETKNININELTLKELRKIWKDIDKKIWNYYEGKFDREIAKWADKEEQKFKQALDDFVDNIHLEFGSKAEKFLNNLYDKLKIEEFYE